ncbi:MAG: 50S ribosomal protein L9 [Patescibacteria group bacterium]|nr:50S ribosomal protein L9 [Patescibacteria group bacterium]
MKVVLIKDVQNLGNTGEIKEVSNGYAMNFLIPGGYVKTATKIAEKQAEEMKLKAKKQAEDDLKTAENMVGELEGASVTIKAKADASGKLYAAIKHDEILKALSVKGFNVSKNKIVTNEPIKSIGEHEIIIDFDHGLEARINLVVEGVK